ncbi:MAG: radical SAM protein [bacterium]|nr:radical SAM protein [bacterium]
MMSRFLLFREVPDSQWTDWRWQLRNQLHSRSDLRTFFPGATEEDVAAFRDHAAGFKLGITPFTLSLIEMGEDRRPCPHDPIWRQVRFYSRSELGGATDYDRVTENWERPAELPTPILHHKYPDRAILRLASSCHGYCSYCYLTARVIDRRRSPDRPLTTRVWNDSLAYLRRTPEIRDLLLSGGDPLVLDNQRLAEKLDDLSRIASIRTLRLNTRALSFNPYRFDRDLVLLLKQYRVTALEIHVAHPRELTAEFDQRLALFDELGYRPLILWRAPLLRGINDSEEVLAELLVGLYQRRIVPYYIFHYAPFALGRSCHGLSVRRGAGLLARIRRQVPGPAFPRYTLFHIDGKQDIPLDPAGSDGFRYTRDEHGHPLVRFINWQNRWVTYPDVEEEP